MKKFAKRVDFSENRVLAILQIRSRGFSIMNFRISHKPALFCIHPSLLHLAASWMLFVRASSKWLWRYFEFGTCIFWPFSKMPSRFPFQSKNVLVWRTSWYARQGFSSVSAPECVYKLLPTRRADGQPRFRNCPPQVCSLCVFLRLSSESLAYHVEVGAKQGGLVWKRRCYGVSISYQSRVKAVYHFLLKLFPYTDKWAFWGLIKCFGRVFEVWHVKIRIA